MMNLNLSSSGKWFALKRLADHGREYARAIVANHDLGVIACVESHSPSNAIALTSGNWDAMFSAPESRTEWPRRIGTHGHLQDANGKIY